MPNAFLRRRAKKIPKRVWGEYAALFDSTAHIKGLGEVAIELHSPFHVGVEGLNLSVQSWGTADLMESLEETISADKVKGFGEIDEGGVQGYPLLSTLFLELTERENHVYCRPFSSETTL